MGREARWRNLDGVSRNSVLDLKGRSRLRAGLETQARARRLSIWAAEARVIQPAATSGRPSWSRARRRLCPKMPKVRSITHRRSWTVKPRVRDRAPTTAIRTGVAWAHARPGKARIRPAPGEEGPEPARNAQHHGPELRVVPVGGRDRRKEEASVRVHQRRALAPDGSLGRIPRVRLCRPKNRLRRANRPRRCRPPWRFGCRARTPLAAVRGRPVRGRP